MQVYAIINTSSASVWDDKECANDVDVLDELIMGIIETRGDDSPMRVLLYPRDL